MCYLFWTDIPACTKSMDSKNLHYCWEHLSLQRVCLPSNVPVSTNTSKILAISCSSSAINVVLLMQRMKVTYDRMSRWCTALWAFYVRGWESWYNLKTIINLVNATCSGSSFLLGMEKNTRIIHICHVPEAVLI